MSIYERPKMEGFDCNFVWPLQFFTAVKSATAGVGYSEIQFF